MTFSLFLGDCLEILPTLERVDHVITDPPYEAEAHTKFRTSRAVLEGRMTDAAIDFAAMTEDVRSAVAAQCARLCGGWGLFFCQIEGVNPWRDAITDAGGAWRRAQIWIKPDSSPQFTGDRPAQGFESIASGWFGGGRSKWNGGGRRGVYIHNVGVFGGEKNEHPTQKPLSLMLELVELFTDPGDTVLDPFMGSGTTGVACLRLGRKFIGIEKDEKYFNTARERLEAESKGLTLRDARAGQLSLLAT